MTKFNIGDKVYCIVTKHRQSDYNTRVIGYDLRGPLEVTSILIGKYFNTKYGLMKDLYPVVDEDNLFHTREEALKDERLNEYGFR